MVFVLGFFDFFGVVVVFGNEVVDVEYGGDWYWQVMWCRGRRGCYGKKIWKDGKVYIVINIMLLFDLYIQWMDGLIEGWDLFLRIVVMVWWGR